MLTKKNRIGSVLTLMLVITGIWGGYVSKTAEAGPLGRKIVEERIRARHSPGHIISSDDKAKVYKRIHKNRHKIIENRKMVNGKIKLNI